MDLSNPQSLNRYAYVLNNPLSFTDPSGLDCIYDLGNGYAGVVVGDCISESDNEYYVDGTIDTSSTFSVDSNTGDLQFGYTDSNGVYGVNFISGFSDPMSGSNGDLTSAIYGQMQQDYIDRINALNAVPTPEQYIQAIANAAPTACGGGVFAFVGVEGSKGKAEGTVGGIVEYDSNTHFSGGGVMEGGQHEGPGGGTIVTPSKPHLSPIIYAPVAGPAGMVLFDSGVGIYVGGAKGPFGGGVGAYINFTTNAQCNAWQQK